MSLKITKFVIILMLLAIGAACTPIYKTCLFGGCYGPFDIVIKTENGEIGDDIVVCLSLITPKGEGRTH